MIYKTFVRYSLRIIIQRIANPFSFHFYTCCLTSRCVLSLIVEACVSVIRDEFRLHPGWNKSRPTLYIHIALRYTSTIDRCITRGIYSAFYDTRRLYEIRKYIILQKKKEKKKRQKIYFSQNLKFIYRVIYRIRVVEVPHRTLSFAINYFANDSHTHTHTLKILHFFLRSWNSRDKRFLYRLAWPFKGNTENSCENIENSLLSFSRQRALPGPPPLARSTTKYFIQQLNRFKSPVCLRGSFPHRARIFFCIFLREGE